MLDKTTGKVVDTYYIRGKIKKTKITFEEVVGLTTEMTAADANNMRLSKSLGLVPTKRQERSQREKENKPEKSSDENMTLNKIWEEYLTVKSHLRGLSNDISRYNLYLRDSIGEKPVSMITLLDIERLISNARTKIKPDGTTVTRSEATLEHIRIPYKRIVN